MKLWKISQQKATGYDTYSDAVVAAQSADDARKMHPGGAVFLPKFNTWVSNYADWTVEELERDYEEEDYYAETSWCASPKDVMVELLGEAAENIEAGVICASFHAG